MKRFPKLIVLSLMVVLSLVLAACSSNLQEIPTTGGTLVPGVDMLPPEVIMNVQQYVSQQLGVTVEEVLIVSATPTEWTDSCFGLGGPAEICAAVITPGYEVIVQVNGQDYTFRTDQIASAIRQADASMNNNVE